MHHPWHAGPPGRLHDHVGAHAVGHGEVLRAGDRPVDVALGREVHHGVVAGQRLRQGRQVADVGVHEAVAGPGPLLHVRQRGQVAGVGQRVVHGDLVVGAREHPPHVVGPDEPGPTGDEELHGPRLVGAPGWRRPAATPGLGTG